MRDPILHPHLNFPSMECTYCSYGHSYCHFPCLRRWDEGFDPSGIFMPADLTVDEDRAIPINESSLAEFIQTNKGKNGRNTYFFKVLMSRYRDVRNVVCKVILFG